MISKLLLLAGLNERKDKRRGRIKGAGALLLLEWTGLDRNPVR